MKRIVPGLLVMMIVVGLTGRCHASLTLAAVSGTVRDVHGTPQMGAHLELLAGDAALVVATAMSDDHGRYIMPEVLPGRYQMRATAAFFVPTMRSNLRVQAGMQEVVNLTLSAMFEAENWLPAQRRRADEPVDDWKWTLRSTASRPLLRLVDPQDGTGASTGVSTGVSTSADQTHKVSTQGKVMLSNGDGTFGDGGMHQALVLGRTMEDGDGAIFRADVGDPAEFGTAPSVTVNAGYERRTPLRGSTRLMTSFQSHPELTNGSLATGFEVMQLASTQQISLGDMVLIDAGTLLIAERLQATRMETEPFVRVTTRPGSDVVVEYRFASGRGLQSSEDLDKLKPELTALVDSKGRPLGTKGSHNEISVSKKLGGRVLSASVYVDQFSHGAICGSGIMDRATVQQVAVVEDPSTGTFEIGTMRYGGRGVSLTGMQPLTPMLSLWVEYDLGTALTSKGGVSMMNDLASNVASQLMQAGSVTLRGKILHTGTTLKAEYRWQPVRSLTQVNAYNVSADEAYVSFYVRQRVWAGRWLPQGMDVVVEGTNLAEQGYQPVLAPDGETMFLSQVPRAVQGGLSFNF